MASTPKSQSVLTPTIILPEGYFAALKAEYEEHFAKATAAKARHDQTLALLVSIGQEVPAGVEKLEKRGRKASDDSTSETAAE